MRDGLPGTPSGSASEGFEPVEAGADMVVAVLVGPHAA